MNRSALNATVCLLVVAAAACQPPVPEPCKSSALPVVTSFNTYLTNGAPVAVFRLDQTLTEFDPPSCDSNAGGPVQLTVTSSAPVPLRFDYTVQGMNAVGGPVWTYQGSVGRLAPGQSISVGVVATTPIRVDVGSRALLSNVFMVP